MKIRKISNSKNRNVAKSKSKKKLKIRILKIWKSKNQKHLKFDNRNVGKWKNWKIEKSKSKKFKIAWLKIFKSRAVWAIIVANACAMLNTNTTFNYLPLYMRQVLHYEIRENGLLSSLPFLGESLPIFFFFFWKNGD